MQKQSIQNNNYEFDEIVTIIEQARQNAFRAVNRELIEMYWQIGKFVSEKVKSNAWGKSVVQEFANFVQTKYVGIKGFSAQNIWRMKQFYETYAGNEKLSTLSRELTWSNNVLIMVSAKTAEAQEFYMNLTIKNNYSARELERQLDSMLFERTMISNRVNQLQLSKHEELSSFRDSYVLEFLDIPDGHSEMDLQKAITANLKDFILEFGKDLSFMGQEYRLQVGNTDFFVDLLFYNRELQCLVAIELKTEKFKPEHLGQLEFYLEALDRDVKRSNENPSIGILLCQSADQSVVEYAMSRSLSPTMVAEYHRQLIPKEVVQKSLEEFCSFLKDIKDK